MAEEWGNRGGADAAKELLLADYAYLRESFWKNEEAGERRVQFFATLAAAVITALAAATGKDGLQDADLKFLLVIYALLSLLVLGTVTLFRIIKRNRVTDGYKKDMDAVRHRFKAFFDGQQVLAGYMPLRRAKGGGFSLRTFGGLSYTVAAINSVLLSALAGAAAHAAQASASLFLLAMAGFFAAPFAGQAALIRRADRKSKELLREKSHTHAGGVVVRFDGEGEPRFLLVKSKNGEFWVLPKGHIEAGESPGEAALREVGEEAGIAAILIDSIGTVRYQLREEDLRVHYFLMVMAGKSGRPAEKREAGWFSYGEASGNLAFAGARDMLSRANEMVAAFSRM